MPLRLSFLHVSGPRRGEVDEVVLPAVLGSGPAATVRVPGAAPRHALVFAREGEIVLQDAGSGEPDPDRRRGGAGGGAARRGRGRARDAADRGCASAAGDDGQRAPAARRGLGPARGPAGAPCARFVRDAAARRRARRRAGSSRARAVAGRGRGRGLEPAGRPAAPARGRAPARERCASASASATASTRASTRSGAGPRPTAPRSRARGRGARAARGEAEPPAGGGRSRRSAGAARRPQAHPRAARDPRERAGGGRAHHPRLRPRRLPGPGRSTASWTPRGGPLRYRVDEAGAAPARTPTAARSSTPRATAPCTRSEYFGTGFLVDRARAAAHQPPRGRAVVERRRRAARSRSTGYKPRLDDAARLLPAGGASRSTSPSCATPTTVDLSLVRVRPRGTARAASLPSTGPGGARWPGSRWWSWAIPPGIEALLAKADAALVRDDPRRERRWTRAQVTEALAARGLMRPSTTQGHIGDVTETDIVFDAPTTQGGSGGPVLNRDRQWSSRSSTRCSRSSGATRSGCPCGTRWPLLPPRREERGAGRQPSHPAPGLLALRRRGGRLPAARARLPERGVLRRGLPREDARCSTSRGEHPTEWVHPPTAKLLIAIGVAPVRLRALGLAARPRARGDRCSPRSSSCSRGGCSPPSGRRSSPTAAAPRRRGLPRAEPDRDDQHLRGALPVPGRAPACCAPALAERLSLGAMAAAGLALGLALSTRWTSLWAWGFLGLVFLVLRWRGGGAPARSRSLASWRSPSSPSPRSRAARATSLSYVPWMRSRAITVDGRGPRRSRRHLELPRPPQRDPPLLQPRGGRGRGSYRPTWYFWWSRTAGCGASSPSATPRSGGSRCPWRSGRS